MAQSLNPPPPVPEPVPTPAPPPPTPAPTDELALRLTKAAEAQAAAMTAQADATRSLASSGQQQAVIYQSLAPRAVAATEKAADAAGKVAEAAALYSAPLPDDEVWLRVFVACCAAGRQDVAERTAAEAEALYRARFKRVA